MSEPNCASSDGPAKISSAAAWHDEKSSVRQAWLERRAGAAEPAEVDGAKMAVGAGVERAAEVLGGRNRLVGALSTTSSIVQLARDRDRRRPDAGDFGHRAQSSMNGAPLEVSVCIGGAPLRTHSLPPGEFVVAQPGSAFTIKLKNAGQLRTHRVEVKVDGQWTGAHAIREAGAREDVQGFRMQGGTQVQQFVFAYPPTFEGSASAAQLPGTALPRSARSAASRRPRGR